MPTSVWGFFQVYGTGGMASAAWIRPGTVNGSAFTWDGVAIAFPDPIWAFVPHAAYTGYLAVDPRDDNFIWVAALVLVSGVYHNRVYVYNRTAATWTMLWNAALIGPTAPFVVDMAFDPHGKTYIAIGGDGARGGSGAVGEGGVYMSVARGPFAAIGSGHGHAYNSGNINNPQSLTSLDLVPNGTSTPTLYTGHTLTRLSGAQLTGWVTSSSPDDGVTWSDPVPTFNGNQFPLECFTVFRALPGGTDAWYVADHSGSGAYSTSNLTYRIGATPDNGPTGSDGAGVFDSGTICYPFLGAPASGVGFPTQHDGSSMWHTTDGGASWSSTARPTGHQAGFAYRGGRTHRSASVAAGVSLDNPSHNSEIWWTEDAGATWHSDLAESSAIGLSLDFGPSVPTTPRVNQEVLTFRDSRMFSGQSRFWVTGGSDVAIESNALAIATLLSYLSNAQWTGAIGPYNTPPFQPNAGASAAYQNIEEVIRLTWLTVDGLAIGVDVPCPISSIFISDQESIALLNPVIAAAGSGAITYQLCTRGGLVAVSFVGAARLMRGFKSTETMRTLDPGETSTAE